MSPVLASQGFTSRGTYIRCLMVSLALSLCLAHLNCASAAQWTDGLGREVTVQAQPKRLISLVPGITETLFALGLEHRIAAVTTFCDYPPAARDKPKVGGYADPSLEAIVAADPELIFASADSTPAPLVSKLEALGFPVFVAYPRSFAETVATIRAVGWAAGAAEEGDRLADQLQAVSERVRAAAADGPQPRVLLCVMVNPLVVAGPKTLADDLLRIVGAVNVVPAGAGRYPTWGPESVLAVDPEVIIVSPHPGESTPERTFERWPELSAVAGARVFTVEADWVHRAGPRLGQGLESLAATLLGLNPAAEAVR